MQIPVILLLPKTIEFQSFMLVLVLKVRFLYFAAVQTPWFKRFHRLILKEKKNMEKEN